MKISKQWLTTAAVVALSGTLAFAAPHGGPGGKHRRGEGGEFGVRFAQKLNLSEAQQLQIKDFQKEFRETNKAFLQTTRETRQQMHAAKQAGDTARFDQLKVTADAQRAQMKTLHEAQMQRIEAILTPDQRAQWQAMKAEHAARRAERGEHRGRGNRR
ncbi:MAG TPA: Spy/CpxP family protein refolding chaperone [Thermoanaerobaculia bacterium]|jgi:Spy/CpxP family protein refolding chaperone